MGGKPGVATLCDNDVTCVNNFLNVPFEFVVTKTLKKSHQKHVNVMRSAH